MSGATYVRFYASDWRSGCIGLSLEQEGLYIRICAYIYETGRRLPLNDSAAAKFLGIHTNAYRPVLKALVGLGLVHQCDDGWTVRRAERELAFAQGAKADVGGTRSADGTARQDRRAEVAADAATLPDTVGVSPPDTPIDTPLVSGGVFSENVNKINGPIKSQEPEPEKKNPHTPLAGGFDEFRLEGNQLIVPQSRIEFWLKQFDRESLDLALIEAKNTQQPNSRAHSVHAQVERKLAVIARDKRDRDRRYAEAVAKSKPKPAPVVSRHGCTPHAYVKPEWAA